MKKPIATPVTELSQSVSHRPRQRRPQGQTSRYQKDEEQLREMARRHISYEIKMLRELSAALQGKGVGPRTMNNALLESFLIHYRNLYDFFFPDFPSRKRLPHDVAAPDYLPDSRRWKKKRPELDDRKKVVENRERVNCLLAHLTLRRLRYTNRSWPDKQMASSIESLVGEFMNELPKERRLWFRSVIARTPTADQVQPPETEMPSARRRVA